MSTPENPWATHAPVDGSQPYPGQGVYNVPPSQQQPVQFQQPPKRSHKLRNSLIAAVLLIGGCTAIGSQSSDPEQAVAPVATPTATTQVTATPTATTTPAATKQAPAANIPDEGEAALATAEQYLDISPMSKKGLVKQLKFEKFPTAAAEWAVNNLDVDWNEQARKMAEQYMGLMPMSKSELQGQLEFEGFTKAQAAQAVASI